MDSSPLGAILFFRLFFTGEVQLRRDLGVNITVTSNRRQDRFNTPLEYGLRHRWHISTERH